MRDFLFGVEYGASLIVEENKVDHVMLKYLFKGFVPWYMENYVKDMNGYAAWWNHILYISGNNDELAFDKFFCCFEQYLSKEHNLSLPEPEFDNLCNQR